MIVVDGDRHRAGLGDLAVQDGKVRGAVFGVEAGVGTGGPGDCGHVAAQVFASHLDRGDLAIFQGLGLDLGDGWACATAAATGDQAHAEATDQGEWLQGSAAIRFHMSNVALALVEYA